MYNTSRNVYIALILSCICINGCGIVTWEYLDVVCNVAPYQDYLSEDYLQLNFSIAPNEQSAEKLIQLTSGSGIIKCETRWEGNNMFIRPLTLWQKGASYTFTMTGSLRMEDGRYYNTGIDRSFHYGEKDGTFYLLSGTFADNVLNFIFAKPPAITSFNENFSISPYLETDVIFSDDGKTVAVKPKSGWDINTIYTWTIKNMCSRDDYIMEQAYSGTFRGLFDGKLPELLEICPVTYENNGALWHNNKPLDGQLLEKQPIGFIFSKPMEEASVKSGISFYPNINGYILKEDENRYIFMPEETYQLKKQYRIQVARTISDVSGLKLFEDRSYFFTAMNDYIKISAVKFDDKTDAMPAGKTISEYDIASTGDLRVTIDFSLIIPEEHRSKAVDAVSLDVLFPLSTANPSLVSIEWSDGGFKLIMTWEGLQASTMGVEQFYSLTISGGRNSVINSRGEYLEEDVCVLFKAL
ncbi:MAG: Ig-like domain-containing protein [Treponema sp.]|jgi:hypothetical protein|nr:Ig-like domain-containing protein [Treponema sp.]